MAELSEQQLDSNDMQKIHRSRSGFWFGIIILLIIVSLAGVGFYLFHMLREEQQGLDSEVNKGDMQLIELSKQISGYQAQLAALTAEIAAKDERFNKTLADFSQLHNEKLSNTHKELGDAVQQLQRQLGKTRGDFLVTDAEYLLMIANERLQLMGDVNTTREALEAADERLHESGDGGTIKVREQIAKELAALKNVVVPDTVKLYGELQALQEQSDALVLLLPYTGKALSTPKEKSTDEGLLNGLEKIVTIRRNSESIKEILTPEEAQFIHEQLRVKLEMAKIALVQHNEGMFQSSLADAKKWTEKHFVENEATQNLLSELKRLSEIKIHSQFPDVSLSLKMLRDIAKLRIESDKVDLKTQAPASKADLKEEAITTPAASTSQPTAAQPAAQ